MGKELGDVSRASSMPHTPSPSEETSGSVLTSVRARSSLTTSAALGGLEPRSGSLASGLSTGASTIRIKGTDRSGSAPTEIPASNVSHHLSEIEPALPSDLATESGRNDAVPHGTTSLRHITGEPVFSMHSPYYDTAIEIGFAPEPPSTSSWRAMAAAPWNGLASLGGEALPSLKSGVIKAKNGTMAAAKFVGDKIVAGTEKGKELVAAFGGRQVAQVATSAASGLQVAAIKPQFLGAAAGHLIHQTVAVGAPTFLREVMSEALFAALRPLPHQHVVALQVISGTVSLGLHRLRNYREQRSPETAARGFHNLSAEQWSALSPKDQQMKMEQQRRYSDAVTTLASAGILTNIALGVAGPRIGQPELAAKLLATDIKVIAYSVMRDSLQASFRMVGTEVETNGGVSGTHMDAAANFYGQANIAANYAFSAFVPTALSEARRSLAGESSTLSRDEAMRIVLHASGVKATINALLETADWIHLTEEEAREASTRQKFDPALKGKREDYMRIFDQTIGRTTAINNNIAISNALSVIGAQLKLPPAATTLLSNGVSGYAAGLQYRTITGTWQAEGAVRSELDSRAPHIDGKAAATAASHTSAPRPGAEEIGR